MKSVPPLYIRSLFVLLLLLMQSATLVHGFEHQNIEHLDSCAVCLVGDQSMDRHDDRDMSFPPSVVDFLLSDYQTYSPIHLFSRHSRAPPQ